MVYNVVIVNYYGGESTERQGYRTREDNVRAVDVSTVFCQLDKGAGEGMPVHTTS